MNQKEILENLELDQFDIDEIIDEIEIKTCDRISSAFVKLKKEADEKSDHKKIFVYNTLAMATSFHFNSENGDEPFSPQMTTNEWRTAIPDDFSDVQLDFLHTLMSQISNSELIARIGDILWIRRRNFNSVKTSIEYYLLSADQLFENEVIYSVDRLERALRLSKMLGKGGAELFKKVKAKIADHIDKLNGENTYSILKLINMLYEYRISDFEKYANITKVLAENAESKNDWRKARECWYVNEKCNREQKNEENVLSAKLKAAESYEKEADLSTSKMIAASFLQKALTAYRRIGGQDEKVSELHKRLLETQKDINKELGSFSKDFDISKLVNYSRENVKGKSFRASVHSLCMMIHPINKSELRNRVQELIKNYPLTYMVSGVLMDEEGKTIAEYPNILAGSEEEREEALLAHMHKEAQHNILMSVNGIIEPARNQILLEHSIRESYFYDIVRSSPLVAPGREYFFAKAIYQGMIGDFLSSINILSTQIEHSMRFVLNNHGVITSGMDDQNRQDDRSLNTTLYVKEIEQIFGEDIVFTLRNILVNRFGGNLRNKVAHGLMWPGSYYSSYAIYFLGFMLRLIFWPEIVEEYGSNESDDEQE